MQVNGHVQRLRALENRPEALVVDVHALLADQGEAVHHRALETELRHGALQLIGRGFGVWRGQCGERGEARWVGFDRLLQPVVGANGQRHCDIGGEPVGRRRALRQHLEVDAGLVHLPQAQFPEVEKAFTQLGRAALSGGEVGRHLGVPVVLLERDDA